MKKAVLAGAAALAFASTAFGQTSITTFNDTLDFEDDGELFIGDGIPSSGFVITRTAETFNGNANNIEIGLATIERFIGYPNVGISENRYTVQPGFSRTSAADPTLDPTRSWWNFNLSVDLGNRDLSNTIVELRYDFLGDDNPAAVINLNATYPLADGETLADISRFQASENLGFGYYSFFAGYNIFNPFAPGTYEFTINVFDASGRSLDPLSSVTMQTIVVPLPGAAGMALAGMGMIGLRRRR
jgi:hypothetical protein